MEKIKKTLLCCALATSLIAPSANAFIDSFGKDFFFNPYVGAEATWRHLDWESSYGENHFRENYSGTNFVLGAQFHRNIAIEGGFQTTDRRGMQSFYAGDGVNSPPALGFVNQFGETAIHNATSQIKGWHLDLIGLLPVLPKTTIYGSIGVAWMRFNAQTDAIVSDALPGANINEFLRIHLRSNQKGVFRLGLGVKQMITEHFGARVFFNWENTSKLESRAAGVENPVIDSDYFTAKTKNSYLFGLGFFYQLCPSHT